MGGFDLAFDSLYMAELIEKKLRPAVDTIARVEFSLIACGYREPDEAARAQGEAFIRKVTAMVDAAMQEQLEYFLAISEVV